MLNIVWAVAMMVALLFAAGGVYWTGYLRGYRDGWAEQNKVPPAE